MDIFEKMEFGIKHSVISPKSYDKHKNGVKFTFRSACLQRLHLGSKVELKLDSVNMVTSIGHPFQLDSLSFIPQFSQEGIIRFSSRKLLTKINKISIGVL